MLGKPFSEIIESALDFFVAQSWQADQFPSFGSLVCVQNQNVLIVAVVTQAHSGSMDPLRSPFPYQKTEAELHAEQPQIFAFLKTTFKAQIIASFDTQTNTPSYLLPQAPSKIHSFVFHVPITIQKIILKNPAFMYLLFSAAQAISNLDELLLVLLKTIQKNDEKKDSIFIREFCHTFSMLTGNDYRRLRLFLHRIESLHS
jgi:hypothetical protein